jgi:acylphosphatase
MRVQVLIQGIVQGVGYRFFVIEQAKQYKIRGYVQNIPDGRVKVVAEGDKGMINDFIECLKIGPISARVTSIDIKSCEEDEGFTKFDVRF